jgi:hypothetical protein
VKEEGESSNAMSGVRAFLYSDVMSVCARVRTFINTPSYRNAVVLICVAQRVLVCAFQIGN